MYRSGIRWSSGQLRTLHASSTNVTTARQSSRRDRPWEVTVSRSTEDCHRSIGPCRRKGQAGLTKGPSMVSPRQSTSPKRQRLWTPWLRRPLRGLTIVLPLSRGSYKIDRMPSQDQSSPHKRDKLTRAEYLASSRKSGAWSASLVKFSSPALVRSG